MRGVSKERFIENFERKVMETVRRYKLLSKRQRIVVALSGGKDSSVLLHVLNKFGYDIEALHVYMGGTYFETLRTCARRLCRKENVNLREIDMKRALGISHSDMVKLIKKGNLKLNPCYACGVLRRYLINTAAREMNADRVAVGHNLDDEAETIIMNVMKGDVELCLNLGPKTGITESGMFAQRVKPLYFCTNKETEAYARFLKLPVARERCPYLTESFRLSVREFLHRLEKINPEVKRVVVENFLAMLPRLRKKFYKGEKIGTCSVCGGASRGEVCRACKILEMFRVRRVSSSRNHL